MKTNDNNNNDSNDSNDTPDNKGNNETPEAKLEAAADAALEFLCSLMLATELTERLKRRTTIEHRVSLTEGAREFPRDWIDSCLERHFHKDWGDLCDEDKKTNDDAVENGGRVLSCYTLRGDKMWVITEADRSQTTCLLPEEY